MHTITIVPGDHTSPECCGAVRRVLDAAGFAATWEQVPPIEGAEMPAALIESARRNGTVLMGHHRGQRDSGKPPPVVSLRRALGVFANVRPAHALPGVTTRFPEVDLVVVRETTEDIYARLEHESVAGVYEGLKVTTAAACERIARHAFETGREMKRERVTIVHKANILKKADGLFLRVCKEVAADYPDIGCDDVIVDALCMHLTLRPDRFDVLLCGNLFGDIVADVVAGLVGGAANCPSINVAPGVRVFTAGHGDPPEWTGTGKANPMSLMFSAVLMVRSLGEHEVADRVYGAVERALNDGVHPVAIGGAAGCTEFTDAVIARL